MRNAECGLKSEEADGHMQEAGTEERFSLVVFLPPAPAACFPSLSIRIPQSLGSRAAFAFPLRCFCFLSRRGGFLRIEMLLADAREGLADG